VYLLRTSSAKNEAPDFEEIRKNLCLLADLRQRGILQSAQILCGKSVTQGLEEMAKDGIRCHIKNNTIVSDEQEYFSVLLETTQSIPATYIGKTEKVILQHPEESPLSHSSAKHIWAEQPEIVILSKANDPATESLARELEKEGAHAQCFLDISENVNAFSRALLGAHTLILCQNAKLTETDSLVFALKTFRSAGGKIISVGNKPADIADFVFPNGFSKADILKISIFEEKI
jgi:hypothetical protein